jgi:hypothetical protein
MNNGVDPVKRVDVWVHSLNDEHHHSSCPRLRKRAIIIALLMTLVGLASLSLFQGFLRKMEILARASPQLAFEKLHPVGTAALGVALFSSTALACLLGYVSFRVVRAGQ